MNQQEHRSGVTAAVSGFFYRHPWAKLLLLLLPAVLWLVVLYLGSIAGLLVNSFWSIEEFTGLIDRTFTLSTYQDLFEPYNRDIVLRTLFMAAAVTVACAFLAFPLAYYMARYATRRSPRRAESRSSGQPRQSSGQKAPANDSWLAPSGAIGLEPFLQLHQGR